MKTDQVNQSFEFTLRKEANRNKEIIAHLVSISLKNIPKSNQVSDCLMGQILSNRVQYLSQERLDGS